MDERANFSLYFAHGDRTTEFGEAVSGIRARGGLDGCSYDCWFQKETHHTALVLHGPCDALHKRLLDTDGWYPQPLEWKSV